MLKKHKMFFLLSSRSANKVFCFVNSFTKTIKSSRDKSFNVHFSSSVSLSSVAS